ncbi:hypothetical protein ERJ75_000262900 [Trypanosoma vivax]|nr:hypothetical protein ERJ75_000262900 [Trypanosoma vivax]
MYSGCSHSLYFGWRDAHAQFQDRKLVVPFKRALEGLFSTAESVPSFGQHNGGLAGLQLIAKLLKCEPHAAAVRWAHWTMDHDPHFGQRLAVWRSAF